MDFDNEIPLRPRNIKKFDKYKNVGLICYSSKYYYPDDADDNEYLYRNASTKLDLDENEIINSNICEEDVIEALQIFVNKHCCYSRTPLKSLNFRNLECVNCFKYVLQTFSETRTTSFAFEPYNPYLFIDDGGYQPDNPWSIDVKPKELFSDEIVKVEIPSTSHIEDCSNCSGVGARTCESCQGDSKRICWICKGSGYSNFSSDNNGSYDDSKYNSKENYGSGMRKNNYELQTIRNQYYNHRNFFNQNSLNYPVDHIYCLNCNGRGFVHCTNCDSGEICCAVCNATGKLRWFVQMEVSFETKQEEYLDNRTRLTDELINSSMSKKIFYEQNRKIKPIKDNYYFKFYKPSKYLINSHLSKYSHTRVIAQGHSVYIIPVTKGTLVSDADHFYIFGTDHRVFYPNYPGKFRCTIL